MNDLYTTSPELASEWHPTKNMNVDIKSISQGSTRVIWWLGKCGHEWQASPNSRKQVNGFSGCPVCSGNRVLAGFNDIATLYPDLAKDWNAEANGELRPTMFSMGSKQVAWWKLSCGHEFQQSIKARVKAKVCPLCNPHWSTGEKELLEFVKGFSSGVQVLENYRMKDFGNLELDIYIPSLGLAVEFNGEYFHDERDPVIRDRHKRKLKACTEQGIQLAVVWENDWIKKREQVEDALVDFFKNGNARPILSYKHEPVKL